MQELLKQVIYMIIYLRKAYVNAHIESDINNIFSLVVAQIIIIHVLKIYFLTLYH